ncbi:MAG: type IV pilus twitching motility protein PilT [Planctomycetes bacterium]|nr:type IV pilus twitching motility protein PilT [Planctomycetota bacterium]
MELADLLRAMVEHKASDLFLKTGAKPSVRIDGKVRYLNLEPASEEFTRRSLNTVADEAGRQKFMAEGELDLAYEATGIGRFRVNVYRQRGLTSFAFRYVESVIPSFEELNLPADALRNLATKPRGLVLATGVAGSGKSTALAAMIEHINQTQPKHIITIEDPIEFIYADKKSVIDQREIGLDTKDFASALKHCMRQSPDVVLLGEMRDQETMEAALSAAETGHLVLSTLHTVNASQTVERIINFFPPHQHGLIRLQLSMVLEGVISLRLMPRLDGPGRVPAVELMTSSPTVKELLEAGRSRELYGAIKAGGYFGMQTFNQSLRRLHDAGVISLDEAMSASDSPDELRLEISGVTRGTKGISPR